MTANHMCEERKLNFSSGLLFRFHNRWFLAGSVFVVRIVVVVVIVVVNSL